MTDVVITAIQISKISLSSKKRGWGTGREELRRNCAAHVLDGNTTTLWHAAAGQVTPQTTSLPVLNDHVLTFCSLIRQPLLLTMMIPDGPADSNAAGVVAQGQHLQFRVAAGVQFDVVEVQTIDDRLATPSLQ